MYNHFASSYLSKLVQNRSCNVLKVWDLSLVGMRTIIQRSKIYRPFSDAFLKHEHQDGRFRQLPVRVMKNSWLCSSCTGCNSMSITWFIFKREFQVCVKKRLSQVRCKEISIFLNKETLLLNCWYCFVEEMRLWFRQYTWKLMPVTLWAFETPRASKLGRNRGIPNKIFIEHYSRCNSISATVNVCHLHTMQI